MQMRDKMVKNACNKKILRYNKLESTKWVPSSMFHVKVKIWIESILHSLCQMSHFFFKHSWEWNAWSCYHLEDIHFSNIIPLFWLGMFTKPLKRYFSKTSEIYRLNLQSGKLMYRKNAMSFHISMADHIIENDHISYRQNQFQLDRETKTCHKQKSHVFSERRSVPMK